MRDRIKNLPVNWIDGMKINKNHFISQDNAWRDALNDVSSLNTYHFRYGIIPPSSAGEENFNIKISIDNLNTLSVIVLACQAITPGGVRINLPCTLNSENISLDTGSMPSTTFQLSEINSGMQWWIVLHVNPFQKKPIGSPDLNENPPRLPFLSPTYLVQVINDSQYNQFAFHPYSIIIGKVLSNGNEVIVDNNYIPPCYITNALDDLKKFHAELDSFLAGIEMRCSQIVQKIYRKNQQNDLSELVLFLCDRLVIFLSEVLTQMRWFISYESPASMLLKIVSLARLMKNVIDLRTGSGKEEMMNYLCEWCNLKQGQLEDLLISIANLKYDNNDVNKSIQKIIEFVKVTTSLFETLSKLEFIGKKKDTGIFVKEEQRGVLDEVTKTKTRRRFFGN